MMKNTIFFIASFVLAIVLALAMNSQGQTGPEKLLAQNQAGLPQLTGKETEPFTSPDRDAAQSVCDQVALAYKLGECTAKQAAPPLTQEKNVSLWYCSCK
ncbi:MAG: hypothetical protein M0Z52_05975 [Actinomycetota bacterium]|nr:hypothetical protein [Actinomycetota bacterium]